jgi:hypothetical protein
MFHLLKNREDTEVGELSLLGLFIVAMDGLVAN